MQNGITDYGIQSNVLEMEYQNFKKHTVDNIKIINKPASELSLSGSYLKYKDKSLFILDKKPFLKLLGTAALKKISESTSDKVVDGLINAYLKSKGTRNVSLFFDEKQKLVKVRLTGDSISPNNYFKLVEEIGNKYKLDIDKMSSYDGNINISFRGNKEISVNSKEIYKNGVSLSYSGEVEFNPYVLRLICTNGARFATIEDKHILDSSTTESWDNFLKNIAESSIKGFIPNAFEYKVKKAIDNKASVYELFSMEKQLIAGIGDDAMDLKIGDSDYTFNNIRQIFERNNIDTFELDKNKQKNLKTPVSVLDVVNTVTDIASHDYGFNLDSKYAEILRVQAGNLLGKEFLDMENLMPQIF